jgi:predicted ArsR family transcriptional regulator
VAESQWDAVAALVDAVRRALFDYVRRQDHPVTREEAADAQGVSRNLAAFHLDKLVEVGLLRARYEAPPDQPRGRGRTPKVYEPASDGITLTVPERRYELIGEILADAVAEEPTGAGDAALAHAARHGRRLGQQLQGWMRTVSDGRSQLAAVRAALDDLGFEPWAKVPNGLTLRNCPFHALAIRQPALICGINHSFITGLLAGLDAGDLSARLAPRPDACCIQVCVDGPATDTKA